ncbi:MAG: response regulator [Candidatus Obscuribacterales bacterium]|jgi:CheY-like chemotaxis protein|nr:response regulator [Candidatus Obscuribacterales bacterium]
MIQKVLLIDDDQHVRLVARIGLEDVGGWEVLQATNGQEGVEMAEEHQPDVILCDVMMPILDGPATLAKIRASANLKTTPVIFLTAKVQTDELAHYFSLGAKGVIMKPFDPLTLAEQVRKLVEV